MPNKGWTNNQNWVHASGASHERGYCTRLCKMVRFCAFLHPFALCCASLCTFSYQMACKMCNFVRNCATCAQKRFYAIPPLNRAKSYTPPLGVGGVTRGGCIKFLHGGPSKCAHPSPEKCLLASIWGRGDVYNFSPDFFDGPPAPKESYGWGGIVGRQIFIQ